MPLFVGLSFEGIFRKTGNIGRQKELKEQLHLSGSIDRHTGGYSVHDCASVLKTVLSDLSEPLLQEKLVNAHLYSLGQCNLIVVSLLA